jgi:hypothetical protein
MNYYSKRCPFCKGGNLIFVQYCEGLGHDFVLCEDCVPNSRVELAKRSASFSLIGDRDDARVREPIEREVVVDESLTVDDLLYDVLGYYR